MKKTNTRNYKVGKEGIVVKVLLLTILLCTYVVGQSQTVVSSLAELRSAVQLSNQDIVMTPGDYNFEEGLSSGSRDITCSGANNTITLTGVYINVPVGCVGSVYFIIEGSNNTLIGGEVEDTYRNGMTEVTDFSAYNNDRVNQANGLGGDPVMKISGNDNLVDGFKLTTRGSFPYGYGSIYGIGADNVFGLDKRCGILIIGNDNTLDNVEVQQRAFGHGIFLQSGADGNLIRNCLVEGRVRHTSEFYNETNTYDLPYRTDYKYPQSGNIPIPMDEVNSLCEDGIRMYNNTGSITVENCTVRRMRGGIRTYLGASANVSNCEAIDCGNTNYNMPTNGVITNSTGNFAYAPLSDFRLSRSRMDIEWTIIPSPHATGPHNLADVLGNDHNIVFHRTPGPLDKSTRAIVVSNNNSTIVNETEYPIILESTSSGNNITSCGPVIDNGSNNTVQLTDCAPFGAAETIEAEDYSDMSGVSTSDTSDEGQGFKVSDIESGDWMEYEIDILDAGTYWMDYRVSGSDGDFTLELDGEEVDALTFSATGADETWKTVRSNAPVYLPKGIITLRINANSAAWNLNWFQLLPQCYDADIVPTINVTDLFGVETAYDSAFNSTVFPGSTVEIKLEDVFEGIWEWTGPNGFTSSEQEILISDIQKNQAGEYVLTVNSQCGQVSSATFQINVEDSFLIEAEDFTNMDGVTIESTTDTNGGSKVSSIASGNWMEYEINVPFSGLYSIDYRVSSETNDGAFVVTIDDENIGEVTFSPQEWNTVNSGSQTYLKAGIQTLRLTSNTEGWEINWLQLNISETVKDCLLPFTDNGFAVSNETVTWTSGIMDISCDTDLGIHFIINSSGELTDSDYLNIYYKIDGGELIPITERIGEIAEVMVSAEGISGTTVELIVQAETSSSSSRYDISKIVILKSKDSLSKIEAEDYDSKDGGNDETCRDDGGGLNMGSLSDGNWLMYSNVNLSDAKSIDLRLANTGSGSVIEIRLDSITGTLIGSVEVPNTGGWQNWRTATTYLQYVVGFYDVYLVFNNSNGSVGNINWLQFSETFVKGPTNPYERFEAEINDGESGITVVSTSDVDGDNELSDLADGNYVKFSALNIEEAVSIDARISANLAGGTIEVRVGTINGKIISFIDVPDTGSEWETINTLISYTEGENDIYFVFRGEGTDLFRVNWFQFHQGERDDDEIIAPFSRIEAESYSRAFGTETATTTDTDGEEEVSFTQRDEWILFKNVDLTDAVSVDLRVASNSGGLLYLYSGSYDGSYLGVVSIPSTGSLSDWETVSGDIFETEGVRDVYVIFKGSDGDSLNLNWLEFVSASTDIVNSNISSYVKLYPNPIVDVLNIEGTIDSKVEVFNIVGQKVFESTMQYEKITISTRNFDKGTYVVKVLDGSSSKVYKVIKQ